MKNRIKECREKLGLSIKKVANKANVDASYLEALEEGRDPFCFVTNDIEAIARVLHVNPAYLVGWLQDDAPAHDMEAMKAYAKKQLTQEPSMIIDLPSSGTKITLDTGKIIYDSRNYRSITSYSLSGHWLRLFNTIVSTKHIIAIERVN